MKKKIFIIALAVTMMMMSAAGCDGKKNNTVTTDSGAQTAATEKVLPPGVEYTGNVGEELNYEADNMAITFEEVDQTSETAPNGVTCMALIFSAKNNSDKDIKISMLDDFKVSLDGEEITYDKLFSAVSAATAAQLFNGMSRYDATVKSGETVRGFVPFQTYKSEWNNMVVEYKPDSRNSNDYIKYEIKKAEVKMAVK